MIKASTKNWQGIGGKETRKRVFEIYRKKYIGKTVVNKDLGITIAFQRAGARKTSHGANMYPEKACLVDHLEKILRTASCESFGYKKKSDPIEVFGYINFISEVEIDGEISEVKVNVRITKDGKFHYSHEKI